MEKTHAHSPVKRTSAGALRGTLAACLLAVNTLFFCTPLFALALVKLALPMDAVRRRLDVALNALATGWVSCNSLWMPLSPGTRWDVQGLPRHGKGWYLVNCNHQTWADIFVLQRVLNHRVPMLKFFLKRELIFVPVIGLAWWALDFPFMKRHGKEALRANPRRREDDAAAAARACRKFALVPTSVMNFAEGTRFTARKHGQQHSPYRHLLKPKAGALAATLEAMGDKFECMLDVTIAYGPSVPGFWDFLCGRVGSICVRVHRREVPRELCAARFSSDARVRAQLQEWLARLWEEKDAELDALLARTDG